MEVSHDMQKLDNIHINLNGLFGHHAPYKCVISPRGPGKSTAFWMFAYSQFKKGNTILVLRRIIASITTTYIEDIARTINKFVKKKINLVYKKGDVTAGLVDVYIGESLTDPNKRLFFRVLAMSIPSDRIKSSAIPRLAAILFDEFIVNTKLGERYLDGEAWAFKDIYTTYIREAVKGFQCIFMGNPYSLYNPYFSWWGVDTRLLKEGAYIATDKYVIWCYKMSDELKALLKAQNPLLEYEDEYTRFAFNGEAVNDAHISIDAKQPEGFKLSWIFYLNGCYLSIYRYSYDNDITVSEALMQMSKPNYWIKSTVSVDTSKPILCFDKHDISVGTFLISKTDKQYFTSLLNSFRQHRIIYASLEAAYMMQEAYCLL